MGGCRSISGRVSKQYPLNALMLIRNRMLPAHRGPAQGAGSGAACGRCSTPTTKARPRVLGERLGVRAFFCKYNDPLFVKVEKIGLVMALTTPENVDQVLLELGEYARDVCPELVRRAVRAIGELYGPMDLCCMPVGAYGAIQLLGG